VVNAISAAMLTTTQKFFPKHYHETNALFPKRPCALHHARAQPLHAVVLGATAWRLVAWRLAAGTLLFLLLLRRTAWRLVRWRLVALLLLCGVFGKFAEFR
jgi:hypothetical protein